MCAFVCRGKSRAESVSALGGMSLGLGVYLNIHLHIRGLSACLHMMAQRVYLYASVLFFYTVFE